MRVNLSYNKLLNVILNVVRQANMMTNEVISIAVLFSCFKEYTFTKNQLWGEVDKNETQNWDKFKNLPGVYIITNDDKVISFGKSKNKAGVGGALHECLKSERMKQANGSTKIVILSFDEDKHLTSSLESYLIEKFNPLKNDKIG